MEVQSDQQIHQMLKRVLIFEVVFGVSRKSIAKQRIG